MYIVVVVVCVCCLARWMGDVHGKYIVFRAQRRHRVLTKNGSIVVFLRVLLNKLWPKNTSELTGYCYSRINLFFIFLLFFIFRRIRGKCILYRKWNRDIRNASRDFAKYGMLNLNRIGKVTFFFLFVYIHIYSESREIIIIYYPIFNTVCIIFMF